jgi:hypothetical protein
MKRNKFSLLVLGIFLSGVLSVSAIDIQVATTRPVYDFGEDFEVVVTVTNSTILYFFTSSQTTYTMDGIYTPFWIDYPVLTEAITPCSWTNEFRWSDWSLAPGVHTVVGTVFGYGDSPPATFTVRPPTSTPPGDFLVDFDLFPGTTTPVANLDAYSFYGVRFSAICTLQNLEGDSWVEGYPEYPVSAEFDRTVMGASAAVAGDSGASITMTARNAQGQVIATNACPPITQPNQFVQTLSVSPAEPIAALEWTSSGSVKVDNLFVRITPPLSPAVVGTNFCTTWPSTPGASYQIWSSTNLQAWEPFGPVRTGTGGVLTNDCPLVDSTARYFRVSRVD